MNKNQKAEEKKQEFIESCLRALQLNDFKTFLKFF